MQTAVGSFAIGVGGVGTTVTVSGLPFQPKAVIFSWSGRTAVGQAEADHKMGAGFMVNATERGGSATASINGFDITGAKNRSFSDACIKIIEAFTNTVEGAADFDAFLSDGFRVIIDDQFPVSFLINYIAIGGADLTNVKAITITPPDVDGDQDTTTVGFKPDCAMFFGGAEVTTSGSGLGFGVAAQDPPVNAVLVGNARDGFTTTETKSYCRLGDECTAGRPNPATFDMLRRGKVTSWLSNGFRMAWLDTSVLQPNIQVLCLKGGTYAVGDLLTRTDGTPFSEMGLPFEPRGLIFASHNKAQSAADTAQALDERSIGFVASATQRNYVGVLDKDAIQVDPGPGVTEVGVAHNTNECYVNQSTAATIIIEGLMDLTSMNADGFTVVMNDPDPVSSFVWYLAMGDGVVDVGGGVSSKPKQKPSSGALWAAIREQLRSEPKKYKRPMIL